MTTGSPSRIDPALASRVVELRAAGRSWKSTASTLGITVWRAVHIWRSMTGGDGPRLTGGARLRDAYLVRRGLIP